MSRQLSQLVFALAALLLAVATALGAAASHALEPILDADALGTFETAVHYQFIHALGLLALAAYAERRPERKLLTLPAGVLLAGIVLFCSGLYSSSLDGPGWLAKLAPVGGVGLIIGWLTVAAAAVWPLIAARSDSG
jgi:uncharacterized membrane protein YgdD (TMEM256/DUF423 family)